MCRPRALPINRTILKQIGVRTVPRCLVLRWALRSRVQRTADRRWRDLGLQPFAERRIRGREALTELRRRGQPPPIQLGQEYVLAALQASQVVDIPQSLDAECSRQGLCPDLVPKILAVCRAVEPGAQCDTRRYFAFAMHRRSRSRSSDGSLPNQPKRGRSRRPGGLGQTSHHEWGRLIARKPEVGNHSALIPAAPSGGCGASASRNTGTAWQCRAYLWQPGFAVPMCRASLDFPGWRRLGGGGRATGIQRSLNLSARKLP